MKRLVKLLQTAFGFKMLLAEAFLRLTEVSSMVRLAPRALLDRCWRNRWKEVSIRRVVSIRRDAQRIQDICKAVKIAAGYVPGATCLVQCFVGSAMLARAGCAVEIRIGVLKDPSGLPAHAWLESEGSVLLGGDVARYTELRPRRLTSEG